MFHQLSILNYATPGEDSMCQNLNIHVSFNICRYTPLLLSSFTKSSTDRTSIPSSSCLELGSVETIMRRFTDGYSAFNSLSPLNCLHLEWYPRFQDQSEIFHHDVGLNGMDKRCAGLTDTPPCFYLIFNAPKNP